MKAVADLTLSRYFNGGRLNAVSSCRLILQSFILIFKLSNVYGIFIYTSFYVSFGLSWLCTRIFVSWNGSIDFFAFQKVVCYQISLTFGSCLWMRIRSCTLPSHALKRWGAWEGKTTRPTIHFLFSCCLMFSLNVLSGCWDVIIVNYFISLDVCLGIRIRIGMT